ncbi:transposase [Gilliamella sp. Nev5-1]|nr:transposase [Gilliamella apicola]OCG59510.1 transposase [Gilliamella apicola]OCG69020.1 transposase [Gilliamella apicola]
MKKMTEHQIVAILKEAEAGIPVKELCRKYGMGNSTFYKWREKYGGMETSDIKRLKELEAENRKLKQMFAELSLKSQLQEDIIKKL